MFHSFVPSVASTVLLGLAVLPINDVHVDASAVLCDFGTGSATSPVCTISDAILLASPGDTIRIAPGFYFENLAIGFDLALIGTGGAEVTVVDGGNVDRVVTITGPINVTLDGLTLTHGVGAHGGGMKVEGNVTLRNSTIADNRAELAGAGISLVTGASPSLVIENSTIADNLCLTANGWGGGIVATLGSLSIAGSTLSGNRSGDWIGPQPGGSGGAMFVDSCRLELSNSTISGNQARAAAGIYCRQPLPGSVISHSTLSGNSAAVGPGGIDVIAGILDLRSTLIVGNSGFPGYADVNGTFSSLGHNIIGDIGTGTSGFVDGANGDQVGTSNNVVIGMLGPLQDNGGPTKTHALLPGSPAIDSGDPLFAPAFDQRGVQRPIGTASDVGAFEFDPAVNSFCNGDGGVQAGCTNCPCGNNAPLQTVGGCINSAGTAARLGAGGDTSVSLPSSRTDDLRFSLLALPPLSICILGSGNGLAPSNAANPCFGLGSGAQAAALDGLRCAVGQTRRHGGRVADSNGEVGATNSPWGGEGPPALGLAQAFGGFVAGQTRYFQAVYRENPLAVCGRGLNTTQAIEVTFVP